MRRFLMVSALAAALLIGAAAGQQAPAQKPAGADVPAAEAKTWAARPYMAEHLQMLIADFNRALQERVNSYRDDLRKMKGYEDMPADAVFIMERGVFMSKEDAAKLNQPAAPAPGKK